MASNNDASLAVTCPRCLASLQASALLAGRQCRCPHCQLLFDVPQQTAPAVQREESRLDQDARPPPAGQVTYIPVICHLCHTRMYGTLEQVGQTLTCPDCGTVSVVPPPRAAPKATAAPPAVDVYALAKDVEPTAETAKALQPDAVTLFCHRCQTRMTATLDQVGDTVLCPDCGTPNVVPAPLLRPQQSPAKEADTGYGLAQATVDEISLPAAAEEPAPRRDWRLRPQSDRPVLPRLPFITGTFSFPFSSDTLARVLMLTLWSLLADGMLAESVRYGNIEAAHTWVLCAILGSVSLMVTVMWFLFAAACGLAVVRDTANGCDKIPEWPGLAFLEWFLEPFYLFNSLCISVMPGAGLVWCLELSGWPAQAVPLVGAFFLFPFVLLSMLENNSRLAAFSWPVFRSLRTAWRGWAGFYVATVVLLVAAGNIMLAIRPAGEVWTLIITSPVLVIVWFIYFRLLGRLAWYCAEHGEAVADADAGEGPDEENPGEVSSREAE